MAVHAVLGGETVWHCENDPAATAVLAHHWPQVPNLGDISVVDWTTVEPVDILTGGFPCTDVSSAGKRAGMGAGTRSGLWSEFARAIAVLRPKLVVIENVRGLLSQKANRTASVGDVGCELCDLENTGEPALRALGAVLGDLAELGYDARWGGVRAFDAGAPHERFRVFIVAHPMLVGLAEREPQRVKIPVGERACDDSDPAADAAIAERGTAQPEHLEATIGRTAEPGKRPGETSWGPYAAAVHRWEHILGRVAPASAEPGGKTGQPRLAPAFVEFLMGLPEGHVTAVPGVSRNAQLKLLGNGVVPQQGIIALRALLYGEWAGTHNEQGLTTLPTPVVNDMGGDKTIEWWDAWTARIGGHGPSLAIEIARLAVETNTPEGIDTQGLGGG